MNLKLIIDEIFVDNQEETIALLEKYEANSLLESTINIIKEKITLGDKNFEKQIAYLGSSCLTFFNEKIALIKSKEEKEDLKYVLSDISRYLIKKALKENTGSSKQAILNLKASLQDTCKLNGYDFRELKRFLHLDSLIEISELIDREKIKDKVVYYYDWKGEREDFDTLIEDISSENHVLDVKQLKKLFEPHDGNIQLNIPTKESLEFLIVLLDVLYDDTKVKRIISPRGGRVQKFTPFKTYVVGIGKEILEKKSPNKIKFTISKNRKKCNKLYEKARKWAKSIRLAG